MRRVSSLVERGNLSGGANPARSRLTKNDGDGGRVPAIPRGLTRKEFLGKGTAVALGAAAGVLAIHTREANAATKTFTYNSTTILPNPERGFFMTVDIDWHNKGTSPRRGTGEPQCPPFTNEELQRRREEQGITLVRKYYHFPRSFRCWPVESSTGSHRAACSSHPGSSETPCMSRSRHPRASGL